ncbi:MAG: FAS1-like dehydratase domain-containing protein [Candidatus Dormibacteria bacterium]
MDTMESVTSGDEQSARITEGMVERAKSLIGVWLRRDVHWPAIAEPIAPHDIRRWALYSVGDDNPLWSDASYGSRTVWGSVIAPPTFLYTIDTTIVAPGFPAIQWIYGGTRWEHFRPVRPGDTITAKARVIRMDEKSGGHVLRFFVQVGEVIYTNQMGQVVARAEADVMRIPRSRSGEGIKGFEDRGSRWHYTAAEIEEIRRAYLSEARRGSLVRYWEDVEIGEELPTVVKGPLTLVDVMAFYVGRRSAYNPLKLAFLERERHASNVYVSPSTGVPVHPAAGHLDEEIAREVGMPGAYDQGWQRANWAGHLVTNWAGDMSFVRALTHKISIPNLVGDVTWLHGTVVDKLVDDGEHLVAIEYSGETQRGEKNVTGTAVVRLPSKAISDRFAV